MALNNRWHLKLREFYVNIKFVNNHANTSIIVVKYYEVGGGEGEKDHCSIYKNYFKKSYLQHVSVLNFNSPEYFIWWFVWM